MCFPCYQTELEDTIYTPKISWELRNRLKSNTSLQPIEEFENSIHRCSYAAIIYTDGSISNIGAGCAAYESNGTIKECRLQFPTTIFTCELSAILLACEIIAHAEVGTYLVASDSMSALTALQNNRISAHTTRLLQTCRTTLRQLKMNGHNVTLAWVPAHKGIPGNEKADALAKRAAGYGERSLITPEWQCFTHDSLQALLRSWHVRWSKADLGRFCYSIVPRPSLKPWYQKFQNINRVEIRTACRIASNHYRLNNHLNRINITNSALCNFCDDAIYENVDHILFYCQAFNSPRQELENVLRNSGYGAPYNVRDILATAHTSAPIESIQNFLENVNIIL